MKILTTYSITRTKRKQDWENDREIFLLWINCTSFTIVSYVQHTNLKVHSHEYHLSTNGLNARCARGRSFRVKQKKEGWYSLRHMPLLHLAECIGTRYNWEYPRRNAQRKGTSYSAGYGHTLAPISLLTLFD